MAPASPPPVVSFRLRLLIRERRREQRISVQDIMDALSIKSRQTLNSMERGLRFPTLHQLIRLAQVLRVSPWWNLIELEPDPDASPADREKIAALQTSNGFLRREAYARIAHTRRLRREALALADASTP